MPCLFLVRYRFDDGDELESIDDYLVMEKSDYLISTSKTTEDGEIRTEWLGVRTKVDMNSIDIWASEVG